MTDQDLWPHILLRLTRGESLTAEEAAEAMRQVMAGEATAGADRRILDGAAHEG